MAAMLAPLGLQLRPAKTSVVCLTRGAEGFDFLGFHHHKVESWRWRGRWYLQRWPSQRAMPFNTPIPVSCTNSSATAWVGTYSRATFNICAR